MTAEKAREISRSNDKGYIYSLIRKEALKGMYSVKIDHLSDANRKVLESQGYKIQIRQVFSGYEVAYETIIISWEE